jgi:hypothetical protein
MGEPDGTSSGFFILKAMDYGALRVTTRTRIRRFDRVKHSHYPWHVR